jgi:hypothetical protein
MQPVKPFEKGFKIDSSEETRKKPSVSYRYPDKDGKIQLDGIKDVAKYRKSSSIYKNHVVVVKKYGTGTTEDIIIQF